MSTHPTDPNAAVPAQTFTPEPAGATPAEPATSVSEDAFGTAQESPEPGFITRHTVTLITLMVAVAVAAAAIAGVFLYRHTMDSANADTEAAFAATVAEQGATLETVECHGGTCAAVINGQAYTVLVQEDDKGEQHFGVSAYAGD